MRVPSRGIRAEKTVERAGVNPSASSYPATGQGRGGDPYTQAAKQQGEALPETATSLPDTKQPGQTQQGPQAQQASSVDLTSMSPSEAYAAGVGQAAIMGFGNLPTAQSNGMLIRRPGTTKAPTISVSSVDMAALGAVPYTTSQKRATEEEYYAEYVEKMLNDDAQRSWWARMAIGLGFVNYDPNSPFGVTEDDFIRGGVRQLWEEAGNAVRMTPTLNRLTPEEWVQGLYNANAGQQRYDAAKAAASPIVTNTQVSTTTIDKAQADAYADQVAMSVLGRMATDAELKKARAAMNKMLAANPTVTTQTIDRTDPANVKTTSHTQAGTSASDAAAAYEMKMRRSSEGTAFTVGKGIEGALATLDRGL